MRMGAVMRNGILYFEMPWRLLLLAFAFLYPLIRLFCRVVIGRLSREKVYLTVKVEQDHQTAVLKGLLDTGNHLRDPLTDAPVIVAEYQQVQNILPKAFCEMYEKSVETQGDASWDALLASSEGLRLRLIPFRSIGEENGMLVGFKPDCVIIEENEREKRLSGAIVGLYAHALSGDQTYGALLAPEMMM